MQSWKIRLPSDRIIRIFAAQIRFKFCQNEKKSQNSWENFLNSERIVTEFWFEKFEWFGPAPTESFNPDGDAPEGPLPEDVGDYSRDARILDLSCLLITSWLDSGGKSFFGLPTYQALNDVRSEPSLSICPQMKRIVKEGKRQGESGRNMNKTDLAAVVTGEGPNLKRTALVAAN